MKIVRFLAVFLFFIATATAANAHPDHVGASTGLGHLVSDPYHLMWIGLAVAAAFLAARGLRRAQSPSRRR